MFSGLNRWKAWRAVPQTFLERGKRQVAWWSRGVHRSCFKMRRTLAMGFHAFFWKQVVWVSSLFERNGFILKHPEIQHSRSCLTYMRTTTCPCMRFLLKFSDPLVSGQNQTGKSYVCFSQSKSRLLCPVPFQPHTPTALGLSMFGAFVQLLGKTHLLWSPQNRVQAAAA